mmetsp:Transcript_61218/g.142480  ORF Transcript_61218/g.142480 Transcript_61218/m.142480 type:complete len:257 (-) Transcript_61218:59-829(-)
MAAKLEAAHLVLLLLASTQGLANAQACSELDEECTKTGCCSTPFSACYKKNEDVSFCRLGCEPGVHQDDPEEYRTPWSCELVTWGCNPAWKPCEGAVGQGDVVPCCQDGCVCNYTMKYFHQCVPPAGQTECSKDGPLKPPDFSKAKGKSSSERDSEDSKESKAPDEGKKTDCIKVGGVYMGSCAKRSEFKAQIVSDAGPLAAVDEHLSLLAAIAAAASVVFAMLGVVLWRGNRISARRHRAGLELGEGPSDDEDSS